MVSITPKKVKAVIFRRSRKARERPKVFWQEMFYISGGWYYVEQERKISLAEALESEPDIAFFDDFGKFSVVDLKVLEIGDDGEIVLGKKMIILTWPFEMQDRIVPLESA